MCKTPLRRRRAARLWVGWIGLVDELKKAPFLAPRVPGLPAALPQRFGGDAVKQKCPNRIDHIGAQSHHGKRSIGAPPLRYVMAMLAIIASMSVSAHAQTVPEITLARFDCGTG